MYLLGKKVEEVDGYLREYLTDQNIQYINDYVEFYYDLMRQNDRVKASREKLNRADYDFQIACLNANGLTFFNNYSKYAFLGNQMENARDSWKDSLKKASKLEEKFYSSYENIKNSNSLKKLSCAAPFYFERTQSTDTAFLDYYVLNNEIDLILEHLNDKFNYDYDKAYAAKHKKSFYHPYRSLEERLYNVALQYRLAKKCCEKHYDPDTVLGVIESCYSALEDSLQGKTTESLDRFSYLNDDITEYVDATKKAIFRNTVKKVKRR